MIEWAVVTTDGSCRTHSRSGELVARRAPGGWAAIVEHGSDGWVGRGSEAETTAVRMEIRAVIEGLRSLPGLIPVRVLSDATQVYGIWERWRDGRVHDAQTSPDFDLHLELSEQFGRFTRSEVVYVSTKDKNPAHKRAHLIARQEAGAGAQSLAADAERERQRRKRVRRRSYAGRLLAAQEAQGGPWDFSGEAAATG